MKGLVVIGALVGVLSSPFDAAAQPKHTEKAATPTQPTQPEKSGSPEQPTQPEKSGSPEQPTQAPSPSFADYERALAVRTQSPGVALSRARLQSELQTIELKLADGRRDEAIADLVSLAQSPRFGVFATTEEGRAALFLLGDSLGRAGAYEPARVELERLIHPFRGDVWSRRAVDTLVDLALASDAPQSSLQTLERVPASAPREVLSDIEYLRGRTLELEGRREQALAAYARVGDSSRFWAHATYLSGLIEVDRKNFRRGEELFCRVADPRRTPKRAAVLGRSDFFRVRDMARLGLGRVAHEQYRFDDARYYYYLVPADSERLPEALYETATTRYEAKDYAGARQALDQLRGVSVHHPYQDEAWILDASVDVAMCRFAQADRKLREFLRRYEPARDATRRLLSDSRGMSRMVEAVRRGADPAGANLGVSDDVARALGALLRLDPGYGRVTRRLAQLEHQLGGLAGSARELDEATRRLRGDSAPRARPEALGEQPMDKLRRAEGQIAELKRLIRQVEQSSSRGSPVLAELEGELRTLEIAAATARHSLGPSARVANPSEGLDALIAADRALARKLEEEALGRRTAVEEQQLAFARAAFERLDRRLSRLLARARLGRIETILGKKRALEIEVEALSKGLLPQSIVDSLPVERYLRDDEEYWPYEGEDWADEYVGGEGLR